MEPEESIIDLAKGRAQDFGKRVMDWLHWVSTLPRFSTTLRLVYSMAVSFMVEQSKY
jgi:hypothetical protein